MRALETRKAMDDGKEQLLCATATASLKYGPSQTSRAPAVLPLSKQLIP